MRFSRLQRGVLARALALLAAALGALALAFAGGFYMFARTVAHYVPSRNDRAEAIVVLTGGELRLVAGASLLMEKRGARLLISGVNPHTPPESLQRISGLPHQVFACCVDIDFAATTMDNAEQTRTWARNRGYKKLIVVTSSYHMPRSLTELQRMMPDVVLVPHPVVPQRLYVERWWTDVYTTRVLLWEYVKFLPSAARYGFVRLTGWDTGALAARHPRHATSS
jgi:uncharacterized SAM-binding protein YcdF (DUF218 family)